jgi:hypothetical protein
MKVSHIYEGILVFQMVIACLVIPADHVSKLPSMILPAGFLYLGYCVRENK